MAKASAEAAAVVRVRIPSRAVLHRRRRRGRRGHSGARAEHPSSPPCSRAGRAASGPALPDRRRAGPGAAARQGLRRRGAGPRSHGTASPSGSEVMIVAALSGG
ncbi:MAG: hypothetical protein MZW92_50530 [Comamonadaceae bacterium]|nr:hypothetical protein [Comamonadaceae bacterium]